LSQSDHEKVRIKALNFYLNGLSRILCGPGSIDHPIDVIRTIYAIYVSLSNSCVYYDDHEDYWRCKTTAEVSIH